MLTGVAHGSQAELFIVLILADCVKLATVLVKLNLQGGNGYFWKILAHLESVWYSEVDLEKIWILILPIDHYGLQSELKSKNVADFFGLTPPQ